jgi:hypothetical protein
MLDKKKSLESRISDWKCRELRKQEIRLFIDDIYSKGIHFVSKDYIKMVEDSIKEYKQDYNNHEEEILSLEKEIKEIRDIYNQIKEFDFDLY